MGDPPGHGRVIRIASEDSLSLSSEESSCVCTTSTNPRKTAGDEMVVVMTLQPRKGDKLIEVLADPLDQSKRWCRITKKF